MATDPNPRRAAQNQDENMNALESPEYQRLLAKLYRLPLAEQVTEWRSLFWTLAGRSKAKDNDICELFTRFADEIERSGR